ncbi:MAG: hypothetical protein AVDCRST_MAG27-603, partial [uncultured Craurococcus sp.]
GAGAPARRTHPPSPRRRLRQQVRPFAAEAAADALGDLRSVSGAADGRGRSLQRGMVGRGGEDHSAHPAAV